MASAVAVAVAALASPAAVADTGTPEPAISSYGATADAPDPLWVRRFQQSVPADFVSRMYWYCPDGSILESPGVAGGPHVLAKNLNLEPPAYGRGPGFGVDVINISHTEPSWVVVKYGCEITSIPTDIRKAIGPVPIDSTDDIHVVRVTCPPDHPQYVSHSLEEKSLPEGSSVVVKPVYEGSVQNGIEIVVENSQLQAGTLGGTMVCRRLASS